MLKAGKLDSKVLKKLVFDNITYKSKYVLVRAGVGEDCAVIDYGKYECVISTDPITAAISDIGALAIHITCNDIATNGVAPAGIVLALMLPVGSTEADVRRIMEQAGQTAASLGIEIIGGHTEITPAVNTPVIVSTAVGKALKGTSQSAENMKPGDLIYMTKYSGLEGTGIIAGDYRDELLKTGEFTEEELSQAADLLKQVSVVKEGLSAGAVGTSGMHDITEGGVLGAVWEVCHISNRGCEVWKDHIPVLPITRRIAKHFDIDYLRLISSGCMLIILDPSKKQQLESAMEKIGVKLSQIGVVKELEEGRIIKGTQAGKGRAIAPPGSDELYKVMGNKAVY